MLRAFREFARVLKPKGQLIATFDVPEMRPDLLETIMAVTGLTIEDKLTVEEPRMPSPRRCMEHPSGVSGL